MLHFREAQAELPPPPKGEALGAPPPKGEELGCPAPPNGDALGVADAPKPPPPPPKGDAVGFWFIEPKGL